MRGTYDPEFWPKVWALEGRMSGTTKVTECIPIADTYDLGMFSKSEVARLRLDNEQLRARNVRLVNEITARRVVMSKDSLKTAIEIAAEIVDRNMAANEWSRTSFIEDIERAMLRHVEHYMTVARKTELEACAQIADAWAMSDDEMEAATASDIAKAIRRRGER
jgi:hypothetical protein